MTTEFKVFPVGELTHGGVLRRQWWNNNLAMYDGPMDDVHRLAIAELDDGFYVTPMYAAFKEEPGWNRPDDGPFPDIETATMHLRMRTTRTVRQ